MFESMNTKESESSKPLAERLRPKTFSEFMGQHKAVDPNGSLMRSFRKTGYIPSLILWGPPGSGKTTFAKLISEEIDAHVEQISAIDTGAKRLKEIGTQAYDRKIQLQQKTLLFVDEIHRFNKAQQDVLLPFVERGDFILIGATTEHPSFELNSALLSRCRVLLFERHKKADLKKMFSRACESEKVSVEELLEPEAIDELLKMANGDGRQFLNLVEQVITAFSSKNETQIWPLSKDELEELLSGSQIYYDKQGEEHYNCISAFIKSIRGSNPDAAVYYLARMLKGGEDPIFIARRLVISASEDIGNADPRAITLAISGLQAVQLIGMPEAGITLAQVTTYLASAPKSNRSYLAYKKALQVVQETGSVSVPMSLRSGRTKLDKELGFGQGYKYSHDGKKGYVDQEFLPKEIQGETFYEPVERGFEKNILQYLEWMKS